MRKLIVLLPLVVLASGLGQNLLENPGFELPLENGWVLTQGGAGFRVVERGIYYHPDSDYEAYVHHSSGPGWTRLGQTVDVVGVDLDLSFWAMFELWAGSPSCWPVASVVVGYRDAGGALLGDTRFYYHNAQCTWTSTSTCHLIEVLDPDWREYRLNVADEMRQHLPGVDPGEVWRVEVALYDFTSGG